MRIKTEEIKNDNETAIENGHTIFRNPKFNFDNPDLYVLTQNAELELKG